MIPQIELPEDVLVAAREALAAQFERSVGAFPYHPKRIRGGLLDGTYEMRAICHAVIADRASRLPRQADEIRKAALEEAAEVALDLKVCYAAEDGWSVNTLTGMVLACRIRALSQKGEAE